MRFLLDANMPRSALAVFARFGHEAVFARDIGLGAALDGDIAAHARSTGSVLLTRDLDFADIRLYPPDEYDGIIVLRLPDTMVAGEIVLILQRFLNEPAFVDSLPGRLAIVELERALQTAAIKASSLFKALAPRRAASGRGSCHSPIG